MSSRHTRRKAAKAKAEAKLERLAIAERSRRIAETVNLNKRSPIERNYYPTSSPIARGSHMAPRARIMRNTKSLDYMPKGSVAHGFNKG